MKLPAVIENYLRPVITIQRVETKLEQWIRIVKNFLWTLLLGLCVLIAITDFLINVYRLGK